MGLQGYSDGHIGKIKAYYKTHLRSKEYNTPLELEKYLKSVSKGGVNVAKAIRVYLNFCERNEMLPIEVIDKYRKFIKIPKSSPDVYVPSNDVVLDNYHKIKSHKSLEIIYLILMTSGIRYSECLEFLKDYDKSKFSIHNDFVSYSLGKNRHTKTINNIYLPTFVYIKLFQVNNTYNSLRMRMKKRDRTLSLKYLRKWHYNFMIYNGVPESVADFIQGRSNNSVSANHYLAKSQQAEYWYSKYVPLLEKFFID